MAKRKEIEVKLTPTYSEKGRLAKMGLKNPFELASRIQRDFDSAEQTKDLWIPQRAEDLKGYYGIAAVAEWPFKGASRFKSNFQRIVVDTLSGNLIKSFFSPERPIRVNPAPLNQNSSNQTLENLTYVENLHNMLQEHEYNFRQVLDKAIPTSLVESFCVLHPVYEYLTRTQSFTVKRWVPKGIDTKNLTYDPDTDSVLTKDNQSFVHSINMETSYLTPEDMRYSEMTEVVFDVDQEECTKDGVSIKMLNGYRFYMPLGCPGENPYDKVQRAPFVVHQLFYTLNEVADLQRTSYFEDVDPIVATVYDRQRELITYIKVQQAGFSLDMSRLEYEYVEVLKWCGKWEINGKMRDLIVWMDRNSLQLLRVEQNLLGIKPYFPLVPFPIDETPYGESLCHIIRGHIKDLDLLIRMCINTAIMKAAPPRFFDPAGGFNPSTVGQFGPNSYIPVREPSRNILQPQIADDVSAAIGMIQFIINIIERITGVNEVIQGQVSDRANTTATEVQNATMRSGVRFDSIYMRYKDQLKPMLGYIHKLVLRNMSEEKEALLMGSDNKNRLAKINKAQLQGAFEFNFSGASVVEEQGLLQKAITLFQTVGQHPYLTYKAESIYYVLYNIVKGLNPIAMDKILPKPEEVQKIEQQNQEAQRKEEEKALQMQGQDPKVQQAEAQMQIAVQQHQLDMQTKMADLEMKQQTHQQKMIHSEQEHQLKLQHEQQANMVKIEEAKKKAEADIEIMKEKSKEQKRESQNSENKES